MTEPFSRITVLGGGLLGGSLSLALDARGRDVRLWCRRPETAAEARARGLAGATSDLARAVADADLVVLAVPVGAMPGLLADALAAGLPPGCLVTDVGSVKGLPHQALPPLLAGRGNSFIGSHPMAGSEKSGIVAADPGIFKGAACLLTNDSGAAAELCTRLDAFWHSLGCVTSWWTAAEHDALVARVSHLPHLLAANAARACIRDPRETACAGNGLRDTTRVAAGDVAMWAEILTSNRAALTGPLREAVADLSGFLALLEAGDSAAVAAWLADAKLRRDSLG